MAKRKTKPIVAVVGRPNVGKSTLFNALAGENISIVKDTPGITRDRIYADIHWLDMTFTLIDTGGIEPDSKDVILSQMREQAEIAMETADVIIFLVDVKQGLVDADSKVADMLRRSHKPVVLVVNKVDSFQKYMADVYEFYNLGIGDPHPISAVNRLGIGDMLEAVTEYFDKEQAEEEEDDRTRVAIVGKPNVGKSSLINKLLGENRLIVSDIAGTTRDAVDTEITYNGKEYVFIDTAGLRRKNKIKEELERYMIVRTVSAVERAEVVVLMIDAEEGVTEQDAKIAGIACALSVGMLAGCGSSETQNQATGSADNTQTAGTETVAETKTPEAADDANLTATQQIIKQAEGMTLEELAQKAIEESNGKTFYGVGNSSRGKAALPLFIEYLQSIDPSYSMEFDWQQPKNNKIFEQLTADSLKPEGTFAMTLIQDRIQDDTDRNTGYLYS